jgi:SSS family solute:Na+ symporter
MNYLQHLDVWIVVAYLAMMLGVALWHRRFAAASLENFFLGGRKIPGWLNGISYTAALISPDAATGYGGLALVTGAFICWWYLSRFGLALFLGGLLFAVFWRRLKLFTTLEFYDLRFPPRTAATMRLWIGIRTALIAMPAWTGITLLASCKIMGPALGFTKLQTLALVVPVSFLYVFLSGYQGVVISNLIQMAIFFVGTLVLAMLSLKHFGGPVGLTQALAPAHSEMLRTVPPVQHPIFPLAAALAWLFGQSVGYGGDAAPMGGAMEGQRILSTRTPGEAVTMYIITAVTMFILLLLVTLPCLGGALLWPELQQPGADRELVYGRLMKEFLPVGGMGLMIAAMLAAAMSTVADNLNFGSQVLVSDIYRRWFRPVATERHYLLMGKLGMLLILAMALAVAFNVLIINDVAIFMLQLSSAELSANWAQWWWWRFNGAARIAASVGGAVIFCIVVLGPKLLIFLGFHWAEKLIPEWWWQAFLVMGLTTALWITVALLTKPDPDALLRRFHQRAQPLGWWGPFNVNLVGTTSTSSHSSGPTFGRFGPIGKGILIATLGAAATSLFILALSLLWLGRYIAALATIAVAVLSFLIFRKLTNQYLAFLVNRTAKTDSIADSQLITEKS